MASPTCLIKIGAGAYGSTSTSTSVAEGDIVTVKLDSSAGVSQWALTFVSGDEVTDGSFPALTVNYTTFEATFTVPAGEGRALILSSKINGGLDDTFRPSFSTISEFKVYTPTAEGVEVVALNEGLQAGTYGWLPQFNDLLRNPPIGGVQTIVNIMDYGAVCDGVTDDSDAWDAVMADVPVLGIDVIEVPQTVGGCAISRPIRMCSTDPNYLMNGVTIRGQLDTPAAAPALTYLVWLADRREGAAASLVSTANDIEPAPDYLSITWTHFLLSDRKSVV